LQPGAVRFGEIFRCVSCLLRGVGECGRLDWHEVEEVARARVDAIGGTVFVDQTAEHPCSTNHAAKLLLDAVNRERPPMTA